jgi:hypothetical protein
MTRSEARKVAKTLLRRGYHNPTIMEDIESQTIVVKTENRCWMTRTVRSPDELHELLRAERA